ncbi:MAG: DUF3333 domain-containing protein, partial [Pseudomonadota bacterium]
MTDATASAAPAAKPAKTSLLTLDERTKKRNAAEARFKIYGLTAIVIGLLSLVILLTAILSNGLPAFQRTVVQIDVTVTAEEYATAEGTLFKTREYEALFVGALSGALTEAGIEADLSSDALERLVGSVGNNLREFYTENEDLLGEVVTFEVPAASRIDRFFKGTLEVENITPENRFIQPGDIVTAEAMMDAGLMTTVFDWNFITGVDTGVDNPGAAGIGASILGSFFMMLVVLFLALPIGVAASIYLEEFAPKNRLTDLIEVNISNLAAVPSIVFGILGLAVFIQFMHLPQSAPLVGGLVLTLMTLPTIIISTRASLKSVPPSIRDAALGV